MRVKLKRGYGKNTVTLFLFLAGGMGFEPTTPASEPVLYPTEANANVTITTLILSLYSSQKQITGFICNSAMKAKTGANGPWVFRIFFSLFSGASVTMVTYPQNSRRLCQGVTAILILWISGFRVRFPRKPLSVATGFYVDDPYRPFPLVLELMSACWTPCFCHPG